MTSKDDKLISVIIPTYNSGKYIYEAVNSILDQTLPNYEIIVIDDGSTDNTRDLDLFQDPRVNYYHKKHTGISSSLNHGIRLSKGQYLSFLDADDLWTSNKLELQLEFLNNNSEIDMVFGHVKQFISTELLKGNKSDHPDSKIPGYSRNTILLSKYSFIKVGLFSEDLQMGEFIEWYIRAKELGLNSHLLPDVVSKRRIHKHNTTRKRDLLGKEYAQLLKNSIDRKREIR